MTDDEKKAIDSMSMRDLLKRCRFDPSGSPFWQGDHGDYALARLSQLRDDDPAAFTAASKEIGWG